MEKIVNSTKRVFMGEFIRLSPKVNELSEILWFVFRMGGSVPTNIITPRFPNAQKDLQNLVEMDILKEMDTGAEKVVTFTEKFEYKLIAKNLTEISSSDIFNTLLTDYSKDLGKRYQLDELIDRLSTVLSTVIIHATPQEPAFLNSVFRTAGEVIGGEVTPESLGRAKELLEYYLFKYLGLVQPVGSFAVNLSSRATEAVSRNQELLEAYKAKTKGQPVAGKTEKAPEPVKKESEPQKKEEAPQKEDKPAEEKAASDTS